MNSNPHNPFSPGSGPAEESLRLIASLPAPAGLEDRVHEALRTAPRSGRVLAWPTGLRSTTSMQSGWMRAVAAAAIVFVVAGGGWGVYTRVQQGQPAKVIVMPPRIPSSGGFQGAGAIRAPQTIPGPTVSQPAKALPNRTKGTKKPAAKAASGVGNSQPVSASKPASQRAATQ